MSKASARRSVRLAAALLLALAAACGGTPRSGLWQLGTEAAPQSDVFDIVPAGVAYAYVLDLSGDDIDLVRSQWRSNPLARAAGQAVEEQTGVDLLDEAGLASVGVDLRGEIAVFSTRLAPVVIVRLADAAAFREFLAGIQDRNPDLAWTKLRIAGAEFLCGSEDGRSLDTAVVGDYAVFRVRTGNVDHDVDDDALSAIILGDAGPGLRQDPRVVAMRSRSDLPMSAVGVADARPLWDGIATAFALPGETEPVYGDDTQRAACQAAVDRTVAAVPWFGTLRVFDPDDPALQRYWHVAHLGPQAAERAHALLTGAFTAAFPDAEGAAFYVSGNVDLPGLVALMDGDRMLRDCPDAGAITGYLAEAADTFRATIEESTLDGLAALAVYGLDFGGVFPRADFVVAFGSTAPADVISAMQSVIETNGGRGSVDETSAYTTVVYDIFGYRVRISKLEDRVVVSVGDVPVSMTHALASSPVRRPGDAFHQARVNGPRLADLARAWTDYLAEMGAGDVQTRELLDATVAAYDRLRWMTAEAHVDGDDIVVTVEAEYAPAAGGN